jgi:hypothetical protein
MISRIRDTLLLSTLTAIAAHGQLYLFTAFPVPVHSPDAQTYPSSLLRPDGEGGVIEVREIASARPAVDWVGVSYDERKAVLVTAYLPVVFQPARSPPAASVKCQEHTLLLPRARANTGSPKPKNPRFLIFLRHVSNNFRLKH